MNIGNFLFGTQSSDSKNVPAQLPAIDANELGRHNRADDAWVAVDGTCYNVTGYYKKHPGGDVLFQSIGRDITDDFYAVGHSGFAKKRLDELPKVATLKPPPMQ